MKNLFLAGSIFASFLGFADDSWDGDEYDKNSVSQEGFAYDIIRHFNLKGKEVLLDLGCGNGKVTQQLANRLSSGTALGLDLSESMISTAKEKYLKADYNNLKFEVADAEKINYNSEFDIVVSFTVQQFIKDHKAMVSKVAQALKPQGIYAMTMPMGLPVLLQKAVDEVIAKDTWSKYFEGFSTGFNFVTADEYRYYLESAKLIPDYYKAVFVPERFPSRDAFKGFISQWFPYLKAIPEKEKERFITQVIDRYLTLEPLDAKGQVHFDIYRLDVVAKKA